MVVKEPDEDLAVLRLEQLHVYTITIVVSAVRHESRVQKSGRREPRHKRHGERVDRGEVSCRERRVVRRRHELGDEAARRRVPRRVFLAINAQMAQRSGVIVVILSGDDTAIAEHRDR